MNERDAASQRAAQAKNEVGMRMRMGSTAPTQREREAAKAAEAEVKKAADREAALARVQAHIAAEKAAKAEKTKADAAARLVEIERVRKERAGQDELRKAWDRYDKSAASASRMNLPKVNWPTPPKQPRPK